MSSIPVSPGSVVFALKGRYTPKGDRVTAVMPHGHGYWPGSGYVAPAGDAVTAAFTADYVAPAGDAVTAVMPNGYGYQPGSGYVPPVGDAVTASFSPWKPYDIPSPPITITLPPSGTVFASGVGSVSFSASAQASHGVAGAGSGVVPLSALAFGEVETTIHQGTSHGVVQLTASASGAHGVAGAASGVFPLTLVGDATAAHGVGGAAHGAIGLSASAQGAHGIGGHAGGVFKVVGNCEAQHTRFEVRGLVRETEDGVLLTRRVRAYSRATGELLGQSDSARGKFHVPCGLEPQEVTVLVIDLSPYAIDYRPPATNRVMSVLARDAA